MSGKLHGLLVLVALALGQTGTANAQACLQPDMDNLSWCLADPGVSELSRRQIVGGRFCDKPEYISLGFYNCQNGHNPRLVEKTSRCEANLWMDTAKKFLAEDDSRGAGVDCATFGGGNSTYRPRGTRCMTNTGSTGSCSVTPTPVGSPCQCPDGNSGVIR